MVAPRGRRRGAVGERRPRSPATRPAAPAVDDQGRHLTGPASRALGLQRRAGNAAVGRLVAEDDGPVVARATLGGMQAASMGARITDLVGVLEASPDTGGVAEVVARGVTDQELLTNLVYWAVHPDARWSTPWEDDGALRKERRRLFRQVVRPALPITAERLGRFGPAESTRFRREVFERQRQQALDDGRVFRWGVVDDDLLPVLGSSRARLHKDVAPRFEEMFAAAKADWKQERRAGEKLARETTSIGLGSAYRSAETDFAAWKKAFLNTYGRNEDELRTLEGGMHGPRAVRVMTRKMNRNKAVPGFSNHTHGRAVDLRTTIRKDGETVRLGASQSDTEDWRSSWLHRWMTVNAGRFDFEAYAAEAWHWDHTSAPDDAPPGDTADRG